MTEQQVFEKVVSIIKPFAKAPEVLASAQMETSILKDLKVNSARLVDVVRQPFHVAAPTTGVPGERRTLAASIAACRAALGQPDGT